MRFLFFAAGLGAAALAAQTPTSLEKLHQILRTEEKPHDAYIYADRGNEETARLLLQRLQLDYGDPDPLPPGTPGGFVCTQLHLIDALSQITNTRPGMYYRDWAAWWKLHANQTRREWVLAGFAEIGLHPTTPIDDRFRAELQSLLTDKRVYLAENARQLLGTLMKTGRSAK
jgi:hypothetical protein